MKKFIWSLFVFKLWVIIIIIILVFLGFIFYGVFSLLLLNLNHKKYPKLYKHIYCLWAYKFFILDISTLPYLIVWMLFFVLNKIVSNRFWTITIKRIIWFDIFYYLLFEFPVLIIYHYWLKGFYSYYHLFGLCKRIILTRNISSDLVNITYSILFWIILPLGYYYLGIYFFGYVFFVFFFLDFKRFIESLCFNWKHQMKAYSNEWDISLEHRIWIVLHIFKLVYTEIYFYSNDEYLDKIQIIRENNSIIYQYINKNEFPVHSTSDGLNRILCPGFNGNIFSFPNKGINFFLSWSTVFFFEEEHFDESEEEFKLFIIEADKLEESSMGKSNLELLDFQESRKKEKLRTKLNLLLEQCNNLSLNKWQIVKLNYKIKNTQNLLNSKKFIKIEWHDKNKPVSCFKN